jgi:hypothetical protein
MCGNRTEGVDSDQKYMQLQANSPMQLTAIKEMFQSNSAVSVLSYISTRVRRKVFFLLGYMTVECSTDLSSSVFTNRGYETDVFTFTGSNFP